MGLHDDSRGLHALDWVVQSGISPRFSVAVDRDFLRAAPRPARASLGVLRVYDCPGDVLSLGRYHFAPSPPPPSSDVMLHRRHSGGRAVPFGEGFIGVSLILPHRSALTSADPLALAPHQVLNRYVRGLLDACKLAGVPAFYPGRDLITVNRRVIGWVSFEVDACGGLLFEAVLAVRRDFSRLAHFLDVVDPAGVVPATMLEPESTTCLAREIGTDVRTEDIAELIRRGYEQQFDIHCTARSLTVLETAAIDAMAAGEPSEENWLLQRRPRADLDHHARQAVQLGVLEAHFSLAQNRLIKNMAFTGDFIANSPAIARLEDHLRGCSADRPAIDAVVTEVFAEPENYILGIGPLSAIAETIGQGLIG